MHTRDDDQSTSVRGPQPNEVARAIRALTATTSDAAASLTYAIQDAAANLNESVRSTGTAILAALSRQSPTPDTKWPETHVRYAQANGGRRLRPLSEKTTDEKKALERMRAIREKEAKP